MLLTLGSAVLMGALLLLFLLPGIYHQFIESILIMAAIYGTGLLILRVPLWAGIGLIAGFLGIIPYLGVISGLILALGFAALDGAGLGRLAGVGAVFAIAQVIEDYVLTPRISREMPIPPC